MTNVDQFESTFRSAAKEVYTYAPIEIRSVLFVTDLDEYEASLFADRAKAFLKVLRRDGEPAWQTVQGKEFRTVHELLDLVEAARPDLIVTYRHLHSEGWRWAFTVGDHLAVLTQATDTPVLVLPHPQAGKAAEHALEDTNMVMAITDHLTGDDRLVNYAVRFTEPGGRLLLTHVEDDAAFERMIEVISKIPEIDTDTAREEIRKRLLKEPSDYIASCRTALEEKSVSVTVQEIVTVGHHIREYIKLVESHKVDLLVMNTKDEDQQAMHRMAYPLAVELRQIPLLML